MENTTITILEAELAMDIILRGAAEPTSLTAYRDALSINGLPVPIGEKFKKLKIFVRDFALKNPGQEDAVREIWKRVNVNFTPVNVEFMTRYYLSVSTVDNREAKHQDKITAMEQCMDIPNKTIPELDTEIEYFVRLMWLYLLDPAANMSKILTTSNKLKELNARKSGG